MTLYFEPKIKTPNQPEVSYSTSECERFSGRAHLNGQQFGDSGLGLQEQRNPESWPPYAYVLTGFIY